MNIHYSILFTVETLHEYYSNNRSQDFDLVPSADTDRLFQKMGVLWRVSGSRYTALIKTTQKSPSVYVPAFNTPTNIFFREAFAKSVMRFYAVQKSALFFNYTGMPSLTGKKFYFSNLAGNTKSGWMYLTLPVANHAIGIDYIPGNLVAKPGTNLIFEAVTKHKSVAVADLDAAQKWAPKGLRFLAKPLKKFAVGKAYQQGEVVTDDGGSNVFEALKDTTATDAADLANALLWKPRGQGDLQYPTGNDLVTVSTGSFLFPLSAPATNAVINFFGFNYDAATPAYNTPVAKTVEQAFTNAQQEVVVDLTHLPAGKYLLDVNGETKTVYYDPVLSGGKVLGVIEIFSHLPESNDYAFLTDAEEIRQRDYAIQFPARSVLWKYRRKDGRASAITDTGATGYTFTPKDDAIVSDKPIILSEDAIETLELSFTDTTTKLFPLPNPPVQPLSSTVQNDFNYLSAELFLNY